MSEGMNLLLVLLGLLRPRTVAHEQRLERAEWGDQKNVRDYRYRFSDQSGIATQRWTDDEGNDWCARHYDRSDPAKGPPRQYMKIWVDKDDDVFAAPCQLASSAAITLSELRRTAAFCGPDAKVLFELGEEQSEHYEIQAYRVWSGENTLVFSVVVVAKKAPAILEHRYRMLSERAADVVRAWLAIREEDSRIPDQPCLRMDRAIEALEAVRGLGFLLASLPPDGSEP